MSTQDKHGKANMAAWEAAHRVVRKTGEKYRDNNRSNLPWREIRAQLRQNGDFVDTLSVPPWWTAESPQMMLLRAILEEAGFEQDQHVYRWKDRELPPVDR